MLKIKIMVDKVKSFLTTTVGKETLLEIVLVFGAGFVVGKFIF